MILLMIYLDLKIFTNEIFDVKKENSIKLNFNCKSEFEKFLKSSIIYSFMLC